MSAPPSVNQLESSEASRRRATIPSSSGVKCTSKQNHTSQEHGAFSKRARDEGQGGVGTRRISATPSPTGRSYPVATDRYTPGLLEAMEDTAVNAMGTKMAHSDERQGDREDSEDREDRAMAELDEPGMAMEVTELLMGQELYDGCGEHFDRGNIPTHSWLGSGALQPTQPNFPTFSGITSPVTLHKMKVTTLNSLAGRFDDILKTLRSGEEDETVQHTKYSSWKLKEKLLLHYKHRLVFVEQAGKSDLVCSESVPMGLAMRAVQLEDKLEETTASTADCETQQ
ncbi:hypothetical protein JOQ06_017850 [Pogonophryne albipinna]|uniref:Uncharacterized protein n=1 Tax=Pogonophryne albipinna TaxID=1090488 RepID=A0AAD6AHB8_9TELE|nr:hypothetical protein JOQ06_017850 [Pogonophryne albipinna]